MLIVQPTPSNGDSGGLGGRVAATQQIHLMCEAIKLARCALYGPYLIYSNLWRQKWNPADRKFFL
jgi:hypothetical protein